MKLHYIVSVLYTCLYVCWTEVPKENISTVCVWEPTANHGLPVTIVTESHLVGFYNPTEGRVIHQDSTLDSEMLKHFLNHVRPSHPAIEKKKKRACQSDGLTWFARFPTITKPSK